MGKPVEYFRREPWVNPNLVIVGGISRGGILSMAYARQHPKKVAHQGTLLVQGKSTYAFTLEAKRSKALIVEQKVSLESSHSCNVNQFVQAA